MPEPPGRVSKFKKRPHKPFRGPRLGEFGPSEREREDDFSELILGPRFTERVAPAPKLSQPAAPNHEIVASPFRPNRLGDLGKLRRRCRKQAGKDAVAEKPMKFGPPLVRGLRRAPTVVREGKQELMHFALRHTTVMLCQTPFRAARRYHI